MKTETVIQCSVCASKRTTKPTANGLARLPAGWKRQSGRIICSTCWKRKYILRAVTLPVSGPVNTDWPALRKALALAWEQSTSLACWAMTELSKHDIVRIPGMEKLPPMPKFYLYGHFNQCYTARAQWAGACGTVSGLLQSVEKKYRKARYQVAWTHKASLPSMRYPYPFPVRAADWQASWGTDHVPLVQLALPGARFTLRLKGGADMRRQLASFAQIVGGEAEQGEASLYRVRANSGDHRSGTTDREPGGGQRVHYRVMLKLVAWLPRKEQVQGQHTLLLRTDPAAFWVAELEGCPPHIYNADHVRRWVTAHNVYRQRLSEDTKYEKRWPKEKRQQINESREKRCDKYNARIDSWCHEITASLSKYAARHHAGVVIYDDGCHAYLENFPWFRLKTMLAYKLDALGIELQTSNQEDKPNGEEPEGE